MDSAEFKFCPFCKERIRAEAIKCRFCGEPLEQVPHSQAGSPVGVPLDDLKAWAGAHQASDQSVNVAAVTTTNGASTSDSSAVQVKAVDGASDKLQPKGNPLIPLFLIALYIFDYLVPLAIKNGASGFLGIICGTLSYCTTPVSLLVLPVLGIWFCIARRLSAESSGEGLKRSPRRAWLITFMCSLWTVVAYMHIHSALELRAAARRQNLSAIGIKPDPLNGWEVMKRGPRLGDATSGSTPPSKKGMREMATLQLKGSLAPFTNLNVDLQGADHDKLVFSFGNMNPIATNLPEVLQQADADFWNRMQFLAFREVIFTGTNYYESIPEPKFKQWSRGYASYVSNMVALYEGQFGENGAELNPSMQKTMRQSLAPTLNGGLKSIYKSIEARLDGENEDRLVIHLREMNSQIADDLLKAFRKDKAGNFWNCLRALAFSELILSGDHYRRSIPRKEFIQWCQDYEKYLSGLHKAAGQMPGVLKHESKAP